MRAKWPATPQARRPARADPSPTRAMASPSACPTPAAAPATAARFRRGLRRQRRPAQLGQEEFQGGGLDFRRPPFQADVVFAVRSSMDVLHRGERLLRTIEQAAPLGRRGSPIRPSPTKKRRSTIHPERRRLGGPWNPSRRSVGGPCLRPLAIGVARRRRRLASQRLPARMGRAENWKSRRWRRIGSITLAMKHRSPTATLKPCPPPLRPSARPSPSANPA